MADAADSKSAALKSVWVQVPPSARQNGNVQMIRIMDPKTAQLSGSAVFGYPVLFTEVGIMASSLGSALQRFQSSATLSEDRRKSLTLFFR